MTRLRQGPLQQALAVACVLLLLGQTTTVLAGGVEGDYQARVTDEELLEGRTIQAEHSGTVRLLLPTSFNEDHRDPTYIQVSVYTEGRDQLRLDNRTVGPIQPDASDHFLLFLPPADETHPPGQAYELELLSRERFRVHLEAVDTPRVEVPAGEYPAHVVSDLHERHGMKMLNRSHFLDLRMETTGKTQLQLTGSFAADATEPPFADADPLARHAQGGPGAASPGDPAGDGDPAPPAAEDCQPVNRSKVDEEAEDADPLPTLTEIGATGGDAYVHEDTPERCARHLADPHPERALPSYARDAANLTGDEATDVARGGYAEAAGNAQRATDAPPKRPHGPLRAMQVNDKGMVTRIAALGLGESHLALNHTGPGTSRVVYSSYMGASGEITVERTPFPATLGAVTDAEARRAQATATLADAAIDRALGAPGEAIDAYPEPTRPEATDLTDAYNRSQDEAEGSFQDADDATDPHWNLSRTRENARNLSLDGSFLASLHHFVDQEALDPAVNQSQCEDPYALDDTTRPVTGERGVPCRDPHAVMGGLCSHEEATGETEDRCEQEPAASSAGWAPGPGNVLVAQHREDAPETPGTPDTWHTWTPGATDPREALIGYLGEADPGTPMAVPLGQDSPRWSSYEAKADGPAETVQEEAEAFEHTSLHTATVFVPQDVFVRFEDEAELVTEGSPPGYYNQQLREVLQSNTPGVDLDPTLVPTQVAMTGTTFLVSQTGYGYSFFTEQPSVRLVDLRAEHAMDVDLDGIPNAVEPVQRPGVCVPESDACPDDRYDPPTNQTTGGTDPMNPDSDEDGIPDGWEVHWGRNVSTGPYEGMSPLDHFDAREDLDEDGASALAEYVFSVGTYNHTKAYREDRTRFLLEQARDHTAANPRVANPLALDSDDDTIPDGYELAMRRFATEENLTDCTTTAGVEADCFTPIDPRDATVDFDGEALTNLEEYAFTLDYHDEARNGTPLYEKERWLNPYWRDTDARYDADRPGDPAGMVEGMPDGWEVFRELDPLDPSDAACTPEIEEAFELSCPGGLLVALPSGPRLDAYQPNGSLARVDPDGDLLTNLGEYALTRAFHEQGVEDHGPGFLAGHGLSPHPDDDPRARDTDRDGMEDGWETLYTAASGCGIHETAAEGCLNPHRAGDAGLDPDEDGLVHLGEHDAASDALAWDTDGDRMPDSYEAWQRLNPWFGTDSSCEPGERVPAGINVTCGPAGVNATVTVGQNVHAYTGGLVDPDADLLTNYGEYHQTLQRALPGEDVRPIAPNGTPLASEGSSDGTTERPIDEHLARALRDDAAEPHANDTDGDRVLDGYEQQFHHDPKDPSDASDDVDVDGLSLLQEQSNATIPLHWDSDNATCMALVECPQDTPGLLVPDGWEVWWNLDPTSDADERCRPGAEYDMGIHVTCNDNTTRDDGFNRTGTLLLTEDDANATRYDPQPPVNRSDPDGDLATNWGEYNFSANYFSANISEVGPRFLMKENQSLDPLHNDTDGSGAWDGWEIQNRFDPFDPDDENADEDLDGLLNVEEFENGTDPNDPDTDDDTVPDGWECWWNLDPRKDPDDVHTDRDRDGLTAVEEYELSLAYYAENATDNARYLKDRGLDPRDADGRNACTHDGQQAGTGVGWDTDGDGVPDGWEHWHGFDPFDASDGSRDVDEDGMTLAEEYAWNREHVYEPNGVAEADDVWAFWQDTREAGEDLHPRQRDTDGDAMPDGWEVHRGLWPADASDAGEDPDTDAATSLEEYEASFARFEDKAREDPRFLFTEGLDPKVDDVDGDGTWDGWELFYGLDPLDPSDAADDPATGDVLENDPDDDGLTNLEEFQVNRPTLEELNDTLDAVGQALLEESHALEQAIDPTTAHSDLDGLPDGWEHWHDLDPRTGRHDAQDADGDGLTNGGEHEWTKRRFALELDRWGASALDPDTPLDDVELRPDTTRDVDGAPGLDPQDADTDDDGMPDDEEASWRAIADCGTRAVVADGCFDPLDPSDAPLDFDGDGLTNLEEVTGWDVTVQKRAAIPGQDPILEHTHAAPNPYKADTDEDGLTDVREERFGTDATDGDTDGDDVLDRVEMEDWPDTVAEASQDIDGDGYVNALDTDSDADTVYMDAQDARGGEPAALVDMGDGTELKAGASEPTRFDTDTDSMSDGQELYWLTSQQEDPRGPLRAEDVDEDDVPDGWEAMLAHDMLEADAGSDRDDDELTMAQEYRKSKARADRGEAQPAAPSSQVELASWVRERADPELAETFDLTSPQGVEAAASELCSQAKFLPACSLRPDLADTDADGMPDRWELDHGLSPDDDSDWNDKTTFEGRCTNLFNYRADTRYDHVDPGECDQTSEIEQVPPTVIRDGTSLQVVDAFEVPCSSQEDFVEDFWGCIAVWKYDVQVSLTGYDYVKDEVTDRTQDGPTGLDDFRVNVAGLGIGGERVLHADGSARDTVTATFTTELPVFQGSFEATVTTRDGRQSTITFRANDPVVEGVTKVADVVVNNPLSAKLAEHGERFIELVTGAGQQVYETANEVVDAFAERVAYAMQTLIPRTLDAVVGRVFEALAGHMQDRFEDIQDNERAYFQALRELADWTEEDGLGPLQERHQAVLDASGELALTVAGLRGAAEQLEHLQHLVSRYLDFRQVFDLIPLDVLGVTPWNIQSTMFEHAPGPVKSAGKDMMKKTAGGNDDLQPREDVNKSLVKAAVPHAIGAGSLGLTKALSAWIESSQDVAARDDADDASAAKALELTGIYTSTLLASQAMNDFTIGALVKKPFECTQEAREHGFEDVCDKVDQAQDQALSSINSVAPLFYGILYNFWGMLFEAMSWAPNDQSTGYAAWEFSLVGLVLTAQSFEPEGDGGGKKATFGKIALGYNAASFAAISAMHVLGTLESTGWLDERAQDGNDLAGQVSDAIDPRYLQANAAWQAYDEPYDEDDDGRDDFNHHARALGLLYATSGLEWVQGAVEDAFDVDLEQYHGLLEESARDPPTRTEGFEDGLEGWSKTRGGPNLWTSVFSWDDCGPAPAQGSYTAAFTDLDDCSYDEGERVKGSVTRSFDMRGADGATLSFKHWWDTEDGFGNYDVMRVEVRGDGAWSIVAEWNAGSAEPSGWTSVERDVSENVADTMHVRFTFDTKDGRFNDHVGWFVDDLQLEGR